MATQSVQNAVQDTTESTAAIGMEGIEYLQGLFQSLIRLCEREVNAGDVLAIARAGRHIADEYHNTLDCIREDAAKTEGQS